MPTAIISRLLPVLVLLALLPSCGGIWTEAGSPAAVDVLATAVVTPPSDAQQATPASEGASDGGAATVPGSGAVASGDGVTPGGAGMCVERYSTATLANRGFAFDGTIASAELRADDQAGGEQMPWVTFKVNRWYQGGQGERVSIWLPFATVGEAAGAVTSVAPDTITAEAGVRLLVAGEQRGVGDHPEELIAWPCGFTQPYSQELAAEWEAATK